MIDYIKEFLYDHPIIATIVMALTVGGLVLFMVTIAIPSQELNEYRDAKAKCKSMGGEFSTGNDKCYVNGSEV